MKFRHIIGAALLAGAGYQAYLLSKKQEDIKTEAQQFEELGQATLNNLENIKNQANLILAQKDTVQSISQDLTYKWRVFNHQSQAHLNEIQKNLSNLENLNKKDS